MTLVEHLEELRRRLIWSLVVVFSLALLAYFFRHQILEVLSRPLGGSLLFSRGEIPGLVAAMRRFLEEQAAGYFTPEQIEALLATFQRVLFMQTGLIFIHPTEAFFAYLKLAFFTGLLLGAPFVLYQVWQYVVPALYEHERRYFLNAFVIGAGLFFGGVAFAFLVVLPVGIKFLIRMGGPYLLAVFTVGNYISFSMILMLSLGLVFELPIVVYLLVKVGLVSRATLRAKRKYVIVGAFALAAIITPTVDPFTQSLTALPLLLLYELSILLARFAERKPKPAEVEQLDIEIEEEGVSPT